MEIKSGGFTAPAGAQLGANYTLIVAAKKLTSDNTGVLFEGHQNGSSFAFSGTGTTKEVQSITSAGLSASGEQVDINRGANLGDSCHSHVYELIIYNSVLSATEIAKIESYLETKYGVVDGSNNYVSSTGSSTYDVTSYDNDIIGIGKECYFHQKQSESVDDSVKVYVSALAASNAANGGSVTNDISYLMLGHDGGLLKGTPTSNAEVPAPGTGNHLTANVYTVNSRLAREWKVTNTNFEDNYSIKLTVVDQTHISSFSDLCLLVDDDGTFTAGCEVYSDLDGITFTNGSIIIGGVSKDIIAKGATKFVTLGTKKPTSTLPVELFKFDVVKKEGYNLVSWITGAEINSAYFEVEKSVDGVNWETVKTVKAAGNSTSKINYSMIDDELCAEKCYYRLNQVDIDGANEYSEVKVVASSNESTTDLKLYPVPVTGVATVKFVANSTSMFILDIVSVTGAKVYEANVVCVEGENIFEINTSAYAPGMYYLMVRELGGELVNKISFVK